MNWIVCAVAAGGVLIIVSVALNQRAIDRNERDLCIALAAIGALQDGEADLARRLRALAEIVHDDALHAVNSAARDGSCPENDGDSEPWPGQ